MLSANQMTLTPQYDQRRGIVTDLLHLLVTSEEPAYVIKSFEHLAAWVDSSLDQYKVLSQASPQGSLDTLMRSVQRNAQTLSCLTVT